MNILIINQPTNNRGDEAAHKSLVRGLNRRFPNSNIIVIFNGVSEESIKQMMVYNENVKYVSVPGYRGNIRLSRFALCLGLAELFAYIHPQVKLNLRYIKAADIVINAPGGICMGLFQNWEHILWLKLAILNKKKIVYYSRSIGPFPSKTIYNKIFKKISISLLKNFYCISLRDSKSMNIANKIGLNYISSIDTAFLDTPHVEIPIHLQEKLEKKYIVFVPNSLIWQPSFKNSSKQLIDNFFKNILRIIKEENPDHQIVMLPQLFNAKENGDYNYFLDISEHNKRDLVLSETINSDIQQRIISNASFVVGARYHSVVFAINNNVPFIALSYEHKITGLLELLNKQDRTIDITQVGIDIEKDNVILSIFKEKLKDLEKDNSAKVKAFNIANSCFDQVTSSLDI